MTTLNERWIAHTADGVVIARRSAAVNVFLVDRPARRRFRETESLELRDGNPLIHGIAMTPMATTPAEMDSHAGWYEDDAGRLLVTQIPELYFGEPMVLIGRDDEVSRAYPVDSRSLLTDEGVLIELDDDRIRATTGTGSRTLRRSARYREEQVTFAAGGNRLAGTVLTPAGPGPHPAAVVIFGAAGGQRDFARLQAGPLLAAGLAVLIYDKAGHGRSGGADPSIFDQADAAEAGWSLLAARPDIDPARIGIAGFSNGMWSAAMVAARRPEVAFVAGLGAPGVSMAESEVHRRTKLLRDAGVGLPTQAAVATAWRCIFTVVGRGGSAAVTVQLGQALLEIEEADDLRNYEVADFMQRNPMLSPIPPAMPVDDLVAMLSAEHDPQLTYDPAGDYARIRCPVLLQYGADDTSVPVPESVEAITRATAGNDLTREPPTIIIYPGLEHMLNIVPTDLAGLTGEEATVQFHQFRFGPTVWSDLIGWLQTHVNPR